VADRTAFINSSYWNTEFVGVGPYRLVRWEPGAFAQLERFDGFYGGPARIQNVTFRFVRDTNTALANVLAGEIDVMLGRSLGLEHAQLLKAQWESRGEGEVVIYPRGIFEIRFAPGDARVADVRARKALYHAMDRDSIINHLYGGLLEVAHSYIPPGSSGFEIIDARTTKYAYDPARADAYLADLGWRKGTDGMLRNDRGAAYELPFSTTTGNQEREELQTVIADMWRTAGFDVRIQNVPLSVQSSDDYLFPTTDLSGVATDFEGNVPRLHGRYLKSPQNPRGSNVWGYDNPEVNHLLDEWSRTPQRPRAIEIEADVMHRVSEDLPIAPINYRVEVIAVGRGITGVPHRTELVGNNSAWNVERWDRT
jgi:peptide/nickel transport system substrate-binding protein